VISKLAAIGMALVGVWALADILRNPSGTTAAANGANSLLKTAADSAQGYQV
jgi:hypothetical protein